MNLRVSLLALAVLALPFTGTASAAVFWFGASDDDTPDESRVTIDLTLLRGPTLYLDHVGQMWMESNGLTGLQSEDFNFEEEEFPADTLLLS